MKRKWYGLNDTRILYIAPAPWSSLYERRLTISYSKNMQTVKSSLKEGEAEIAATEDDTP
jgi:hypothetical protein